MKYIPFLAIYPGIEPRKLQLDSRKLLWKTSIFKRFARIRASGLASGFAYNCGIPAEPCKKHVFQNIAIASKMRLSAPLFLSYNFWIHYLYVLHLFFFLAHIIRTIHPMKNEISSTQLPLATILFENTFNNISWAYI